MGTEPPNPTVPQPASETPADPPAPGVPAEANAPAAPSSEMASGTPPPAPESPRAPDARQPRAKRASRRGRAALPRPNGAEVAPELALAHALLETLERELPGAGARSGPTTRGPGDAAVPRFSPTAWRGIGRDIQALHDGYTRRDGSFGHDANPIHARLAAYQLYFLPRNWFRVQRVLERLPWAGGPPHLPAAWIGRDGDTDTLHLLDIGCGSGAFSLAWLTHLTPAIRSHGRPVQLHLTLVDQGRHLLELAQANIAAYARRALPGVTLTCEARADGVQAWVGGQRNRRHYAIVGGAMMLNELDLVGPRRVSDRATALADALRPQLRPGGCLLFVEPGTRKGFMNLMVLRDRLLELTVLYPCAHGHGCPMWSEGVRHWCHATERLPAGFFFDAHLKQRAGVTFDMRDVQLAAIAHQGGSAAEPQPPFQREAGARIVSAPMRARPQSGMARKQSPPAPSPAPERIVLVCTPEAQLEERPAPSGGPYTRGEWFSPNTRR